MNTLQTITQSSALSLGMIPSSIASATAFATAACAGPKILLTSSRFFTVTFGTINVWGFGGRFGLMTASNGVWPTERFEIPAAKASPTGPHLSPINKSMCATSFPSPTRASPIKYVLLEVPTFSPSYSVGMVSVISLKSTLNSLSHVCRVSRCMFSASAVAETVGFALGAL